MTETVLSFAVLGDPVEHSVSPDMYRAAFEELGIAARYGRQRVNRPSLAAAMSALCDGGGGGNVTLPHKQAAAEIVDLPSEAVVRSGACNCFWADADAQIAGDNTDVDGLLAAVARLPRFEMSGARVLVLGAGGAGRAAVLACERGGAESVWLRNRTSSRAEKVLSDFGTARLDLRLADFKQLSEFDLIINATSLGLSSSDPLPLNLAEVRAGYALDLVYGRDADGTPWVQSARAKGMVAADGLDMLVQQALLSVERWLGCEAPAACMKRAALKALGRPWLAD
ncbi:MAG: shikimate dehydrogenase [Gemmatimonadota bacterium]